MSNVFLASDYHYGHGNILTFLDNEGNKLRSFSCVEEMDEHMVAQHNKVVSPRDKTYMLGDIAFTKKSLALLARMNGEKVLIKGNHDKLKLQDYVPYFKDIRGSHQFDGIVMTHIPVHPASLARWPTNVHGHLHSNKVMLPIGGFGTIPAKPDPRYYCVCMEQLDDYTPVSLEQLKKNILERQSKV